MPGYQNWLLDQEDHVARLTLNRPQATNSLTAETLYELRAISHELGASQAVWAVVLQGAGRHFSLGIDVSTIQGRLEQPTAANRAYLADLQACFDAFEALEKPTIARLHGFCLGGGLMLALCCDFRIASQRAIFGLPEVRLGLPMIMGTRRVVRVAGVAAAKELLLLGRRYKAEAARAYGLLHQVVPPDELDGAVQALAAQFQGLPPRTVGLNKRLIHAGCELSAEKSQELEIQAMAELSGSPDLAEAMASYLEKRRPEFVGA